MTLSRAKDVRWSGQGSLVLADAHSGIVQLNLETGETGLRVPQGSGPRDAYRPVHIAAHDLDLAFGFALFEVGFLKRGATSPSWKLDFESIEDLDLREGRLAVLGLRRDGRRTLAPDGAFVWVISVAGARAEPVPILFARGGPGAPAFHSCLVMEIGGLRFLEDGSLFVVPGAEPGAFRFDAHGKLDRVWPGDELGPGVPCSSMSALDRELLAANRVSRASWLNAFETLDELLPVAGGALAILRSAGPLGTVWRAVHFSPDGGVRKLTFPYRSNSPYAHLRGDVLGESVTLLEFDLGDDAVAYARRLSVARWSISGSTDHGRPALLVSPLER